ncbi:MAG: glycosyltransferase [Chloroflexi bacterium]|nr:glycosyltransferase [Chloroflexota bacterium]
MKVLHVSLSDGGGGAAMGAYRLHQSLRRAGLESEMLVLRKVTEDPSAHRLSDALNRWERLRRRWAERRHNRELRRNPRIEMSGQWSLNLYRYSIADAINSFAADIVQLHWVGDNFVPIQELVKIRAPIVWTLRDMWAFTGGCHYAGECVNYRALCGRCPQLVNASASDLSARIHTEKRRAWSNLPLTIVTISEWLADCARASSLLGDRRIEVIGNPIDPSRFKPLERGAARQAFNLPQDKRLILFGAIGGASDPRKGFRYLAEALAKLGCEGQAELVVFGSARHEDIDAGLPAHQLGRFQDEVSLSLLYSACDVYVLPTVQEALGKTLQEALACGTPCVTFAGTGPDDIVAHRHDGYRARMGDSADLAAGIEWTLAQSWSRRELHQRIVAKYGVERISQRYIRLYESLIGG